MYGFEDMMGLLVFSWVAILVVNYVFSEILSWFFYDRAITIEFPKTK